MENGRFRDGEVVRGRKRPHIPQGRTMSHVAKDLERTLRMYRDVPLLYRKRLGNTLSEGCAYRFRFRVHPQIKCSQQPCQIRRYYTV